MTTTAHLADTPLHRTPFHQYHLDHGGKMVPFAGWEMPIRYGSIIEEHHQTRRSGGMFDVSHMGRVRFTGRDARRFLDRICTRQIIDMQPGMVRYSLVCNEQGGCRDDVLIYRIAESEFLMVCNASNRLKLLEHFNQVRGDLVFKIKDETQSTAMIALQGPRVMGMIAQFSSEIPALKRYRFTTKDLLLAKVLVSRTGYTGEDGVEVILPNMLANRAVDMMMKNAPDPELVKPCGLGARDSLRLEAGMPLYGHEIEEHLDPVSAGLHFAVKLNKGEENPEAGRFIGQDALEAIAKAGPKRKLVGLTLESKRAARQGMRVLRGDAEVGYVTSGCWSPTLEKSIAMAYVDAAQGDEGATLTVDPDKLSASAVVTALPFYKASA